MEPALVQRLNYLLENPSNGPVSNCNGHGTQVGFAPVTTILNTERKYQQISIYIYEKYVTFIRLSFILF